MCKEFSNVNSLKEIIFKNRHFSRYSIRGQMIHENMFNIINQQKTQSKTSRSYYYLADGYIKKKKIVIAPPREKLDHSHCRL